MLSTKQVAETLGVHEKTVYFWIKQKRIKAIKIGRNFKIAEVEVEFIKNNGLREQ